MLNIIVLSVLLMLTSCVDFEFGTAGSNKCPLGYTTMTSLGDCQQALGQYYGFSNPTYPSGTVNNPSLPSGCLTNSNNNLAFNTYETGVAQTGWIKVCIALTPEPTNIPTSSIPTIVPTTSEPTDAPSNGPTTTSPTMLPTTTSPTMIPTTPPTTSVPTHDPSLAPTSSDPTPVPTHAPTTSEPTESPTWSADATQENVLFDNYYLELMGDFGDAEAFLAECTIRADVISIGEVACASVFPTGGKTAVALVGGSAEVQLVADWVSEHGLIVYTGTSEITLYPEGWFATSTTSLPTGSPTLTETQISIVCEDNEELVTIDVNVGTWYDATIGQRWTLSESCEHMSGYMNSDSGFTTHTKTCCLPSGTYTLTCYSGSTFGWMGGSVKVNGVEYCSIDGTNTEESYDVSLCSSANSCGEAPADFYQLTDECDGGFVPQISMAIGTSSSSSTEAISWKLTDACQGGNYPALASFGNHEYHPADCCLPRGKYTLTCSSTGVFTWQNSFVLVNGRQYCFGSDGGESHVIDMCSGVEPCPDFTTNEVGSTFQPQIQIGGVDTTTSLSGEIVQGEQHNDSCFFANDGECDVGGYFPLCNEGTDCADCGDCDTIFKGSSSAGTLAFHASLFFLIILF